MAALGCHGESGMRQSWRLALAASVGLMGSCGIAHAMEWKPIEAEPSPEQSNSHSTEIRWTPIKAAPTTASQKPQWQELTADPDHVLPEPLVWTPVEPSVAADIEEKIEDEAPITDPANASVAIQPPVMPSGPTFANDKAIWRDDSWYPQISSTVPIGFGPQGFMLSGSLWGIDCVTGAGFCSEPSSWDEYLDQIEKTGDAHYNLSIGFGDAEKLFGLTITSRFEETSLKLGNRNQEESNTRNLFSNYYIGAHLSRNFGSDTALKIGIDNWLDVRECDFCGFPKSTYAVVSQRFRINKDQNAFFPNAYLTLGMGNGQFRPLDELIRASVAEQRKAGCITAGFTPEEPCSTEALQRATWKANSYGQFNPIGALAIETFSGFHLIGEWTGRNLNAGFSLRPFEEFGLVITSMWENLIANCDWGCTVKGIPDYPQGIDLDLLPSALTERPRFSFQISLEAKF